jgi:excisionase family DNA binding protein
MNPDDRLITLNELCERLSLKPWAIRKKIRTGLLRGYNLDGRWRFSQSQIDEYLQPRESGQKPPPPTRSTRLLTQMPDGSPFLL